MHPVDAENLYLAERALRDVAYAAGFQATHDDSAQGHYLDAMMDEGSGILRRFGLPVPEEVTHAP